MKRLVALLALLPLMLMGADSLDVPSALSLPDGTQVTNKRVWERNARQRWFDIFASELYGVVPKLKYNIETHQGLCNTQALDGKATMREIVMTISTNGMSHKATMLLITPNGVKRPPVILGLNFNGNYTVVNTPTLRLPTGWMPNARGVINNNRANELHRGFHASQWQVDYLISRGYAVATLFSGDLFPDHPDGFDQSAWPMIYSGSDIALEQRASALGVWAWGLSRAMDYLQRSPYVDHRNVALFGHSRLGKAAIWAAASDDRFAAVMLNESGCGGASLFRNIPKLERIGDMNRKYPHWLNVNSKKYDGKEALLPVDQNILLALIAPMPLYVASAEADTACDHERQWAALRLSGEVYGGIYGLSGELPAAEPALNTPFVSGVVGYHLRDGRHDVTLYDWQCYLDFLDKMRSRP